MGEVLTVAERQPEAVPSLADPGQRAAASRLLRSLLLAVLGYGYTLQIPFLVERAADGPVVGDVHGLPVETVT